MTQRMTMAIVVVCVAVAGAWFAWPSGRGVRAQVQAQASRARAGAAAAPRRDADNAAIAKPTPKIGVPADALDDKALAEVRAELERRAQAGDAKAASRLGQAFLYCNDLPVATDAQIDDVVVEIAARGGHVLGQAGSSLTPDQQASMLKAAMKYAQTHCANAHGINEKDAPAQAFRWIERAAALGDADAQALYGEAMLKTYDTRTAIDGAEVLRGRLQQARTYVAQSLSRGDALALLQMQTYYGDGVYRADPQAAYANLFAYSLTPRSTDLPPELLALMLSEASEKLDADAVERAREEGRRLAACCGGEGGTP